MNVTACLSLLPHSVDNQSHPLCTIRAFLCSVSRLPFVKYQDLSLFNIKASFCPMSGPPFVQYQGLPFSNVRASLCSVSRPPFIKYQGLLCSVMEPPFGLISQPCFVQQTVLSFFIIRASLCSLSESLFVGYKSLNLVFSAERSNGFIACLNHEPSDQCAADFYIPLSVSIKQIYFNVMHVLLWLNLLLCFHV